MRRVLLLGGTTEASQLAQALANAGIDAVFSYAGRTADPVAQPLPQRIGGFGGVAGLTAYLRDEAISHVIDATHAFAAEMSRNAATACAQLGLPLAAFERPAWQPRPGDQWTQVPTLDDAALALPLAPARVFLAIGRQNLHCFAAMPQHHYLLRLVDPATDPLPLPHIDIVIARGPFVVAQDLALMRDHRIEIVVAKNAGGSGAEAKLTAARDLGLPVIMVNRPALPDRPSFATLAEVMHWISHPADLGL